MTCNDCIHQIACLNWCKGFGQEAELCEHFSDKSEWVHLPCKLGDRVFAIVVFGNGESKIVADRVSGFIRVGDTLDIITNVYLDGGTWGYNVFPTQEEAENALEERRSRV